VHPALGVLLNAEYPPSELIELGRLTESLGYQSLWYTDVRYLRECYLGLAALATNTQRIELGPGVTDPYSRHPAITATTIATFDELCGGRALLGLGVGASLQNLGIAQPLPVAALRETVDVVRRLLRGEEVTLEGKVVSIKEGRLGFVPLRDAIPIYFATHGAQVTRLAGEVADGVLLANILVPSALDSYVERLREGMARGGRAEGAVEICLRFEACISDDEEAAFAVMRRRMAARLLAQYPHWEYLEMLGVSLPQPFVDFARAGARPAEAASALPDDVVVRTTLAGRPERVAEQVARMLRPEVTQVTIRPHSLPGQGVGPVLRSFAEEVMPRVESLTRA
jgi:5,10-methylenetetrahydromethanopterin reductase